MATEIRVPTLGESVTEAIVGKWYKKAGDAVKADEPLVELETDKVTLEVNAPSAGVISEILVKEGETVEVGAVLGSIGEGSARRRKPAAQPDKAAGEKVVAGRSPMAASRPPPSRARPIPALKPASGRRRDAVSGRPQGGHREQYRSRDHSRAPARTAAS